MAETANKTTSSAKSAEEGANTAVPHEGDHDRVQMLSLRADGTPDQHNPELIGEKDATLAATKEQFRQQAVSAADVAESSTGGTSVDDAPQDPAIQAKVDEHQALEANAEKAAESAVDALTQG